MAANLFQLPAAAVEAMTRGDPRARHRRVAGGVFALACSFRESVLLAMLFAIEPKAGSS
jgi:hypothetical protein